jgi:modification methylase
MKPYYEHAGITIFHGDCREVLPTLDGVDLVFTSPPYNLGNTTGGGMPHKKLGHYDPRAGMTKRGGGGKWSGGALAFGYGQHDDNMPHEEYVAWQRDVVSLCWATLTDTGAVFYNHKPRVLDGVLVTPFAYLPPDIPVRQVVIWARAGGVNFSPAFYLPTHEWVVILAKPEWRLKSKGASGIGDVWRVPQEAGTEHPAPFPVALPGRAIESAAPKLVLDPFAGSGSTLVAAKNAGTRAIGVELEERHCELAARRLAQESLFGGGVA